MTPSGVCEEAYPFTVNKPLTMIEGTLPTQFSKICQDDRIGFGGAAGGSGVIKRVTDHSPNTRAGRGPNIILDPELGGSPWAVLVRRNRRGDKSNGQQPEENGGSD
jgi:hypothetical protein